MSSLFLTECVHGSSDSVLRFRRNVAHHAFHFAHKTVFRFVVAVATAVTVCISAEAVTSPAAAYAA